MKIYVVYFRTMIDSPDVTINCVTSSRAIAELALTQAKRAEEEFMADRDEDSSDWADACIEEFDIFDAKQGETLYLLIETLWHEEVTTTIHVFRDEANAVARQSFLKEDILSDYPGIVPFEEGESFDQACHLYDDSVMVDYWTYVEPVTIQ